MKTLFKRRGFGMTALAAALFLSLAACEEQGPAEEAGEEMGKAMDEMGEDMGKAMEDAGEKMEETGEEMEESAQ